jgi:hypothetical protein
MEADVTAPALARRAGSAILGTEERPATTAQTYRSFNLNWQKMLNYRYASGNAVQNESEEGPGLPENPPHTVLNAANYGAEPTFFRFGISPLSAAGNAGCAAPITAPTGPNFDPATPTCFGAVVNAGSIFSNTITDGVAGVNCSATPADPRCDPKVPLFNATPGQQFRIELTSANSSNRATTFTLHGHVWPRDPFLSAQRNAAGFPNNANVGNVGSVIIGSNPMEMAFGAQESIIGSAHYVIKPYNGAGGADAVPGDYLMRDTAAAGFGGGAWGILRVQ